MSDETSNDADRDKQKEIESTTPLIPDEVISQIQETIRETISIEYSWRGPFPPPEVLEAYGKTVPTMPERLLQEYERVSQHNIKRDNRITGYLGIALFLFTLIALAGLALGGYMVYQGYDITGAFTGLGSLTLTLLGFAARRVWPRRATEHEE
ncbi:MAG: hypothetical protein OXF04_06865 [bacterium]|nr:hypothetical protein [bacterium]